MRAIPAPRDVPPQRRLISYRCHPGGVLLLKSPAGSRRYKMSRTKEAGARRSPSYAKVSKERPYEEGFMNRSTSERSRVRVYGGRDSKNTLP